MESIEFLTSYFGFIKQAEQLINTGAYAKALLFLEDGASIYTQYPRVRYLRGLCFLHTANWAAAIDEWQSLLKYDPHHEAAMVFTGLCLFNQGNIPEAEQWLKLAVETYPASVHAQTNLFALQLKKEGPAQLVKTISALACSEDKQADFHFRLDPFSCGTLFLSNSAIAIGPYREINFIFKLPGTPGAAKQDLRPVYESFEPVGDDCEFGLVERNHKAEPMALFRWVSISAENLTRALRNRLEDYDKPEHYSIKIVESGECQLTESVYGSQSHTFVNSSGIDVDEFRKKLHARQTFLKRKFLEDIATGDKIFVYKTDKNMSPAAMDDLQDSLMALGARKFLFVIRTTAEHPAGSTFVQKDNRVLGFVSDFMPGIQYSQWDSIVKSAHDYFNSRIQ